MRQLGMSQPKILFQAGVLDQPYAEEPPTAVRATIRYFAKSFRQPLLLPEAWKDDLDRFAPFEDLDDHFRPESYFIENPSHALDSSDEAVLLFRHLKKVMRISSKLHTKGEDEHPWYSLVELLLAGPSDEDDFEVVKSVNKQLRKDLVPIARMGGQTTISSCRPNFFLTFDRADSTFLPFYEEIANRAIGMPMGPTTDPLEQDSVVGCMVEVKSENGSYLDALMQLAISSFANIKLVDLNTAVKTPVDSRFPNGSADSQSSQSQDQSSAQLPFPSISVVGHEWSLHWIFKKDEGTLIVAGPFPMGTTKTFLDICSLVKSINGLKMWLRSSYWPWLESRYRVRFPTEMSLGAIPLQALNIK